MKTSLRLLALATLALLVSIEGAAAGSLSGTWSGSGTAVPNDGAKEKVSCRMTYSPQGGKLVGVNVKCTSTSAKPVSSMAGQILCMAMFNSNFVIFRRFTSDRNADAAAAMPFATASQDTSLSRTLTPERASAHAIPLPMMPAPITAARRTGYVPVFDGWALRSLLLAWNSHTRFLLIEVAASPANASVSIAAPAARLPGYVFRTTSSAASGAG